MSSKRKLGIFLVATGIVLLIKDYFPEVISGILNLITMPLLLIALGLYLFITTKN